MGWFSKICSAVVRVATAVVKWVAAGVQAVVQFAKKTVEVVKEGWQAVVEIAKKTVVVVKTAVEKVLGPSADELEDLDVGRRLREARNALAVAESRLSDELTHRTLLCREDERVEAERRQQEALAAHERAWHAARHDMFKRRAAETKRRLDRLLESSEVHDFEEFACLRLASDIVGHLEKKTTTLDGFLALSHLELRAIDAIPVLMADSASVDDDAHLRNLDEYCKLTLNRPLMVAAAEAFFLPYNLQLATTMMQLEEWHATLNRKRTEVTRLEIKRQVEGLSVSEEELLEQVRLESDALESTIETEKRRKGELVDVTGVNEGLLCILTGDENDEYQIRAGKAVGQLLVEWQQRGRTLTNDEREDLRDFAEAYGFRSRERTRLQLQDVSVGV